MTRMQFWRFILDCNLHSYGIATMEYDRLIGNEIFISFCFLSFRKKIVLAECLPTENLHAPDESILVREFLNAIAIMCFHLHRLKKMFVSFGLNHQIKSM